MMQVKQNRKETLFRLNSRRFFFRVVEICFVFLVAFQLGVLYSSIFSSAVLKPTVEKEKIFLQLQFKNGRHFLEAKMLSKDKVHVAHQEKEPIVVEGISEADLRKRYLAKYQDPNKPDFIKVFEDHLPEKSLQSECASVKIGTKIYCIGGLSATMHEYEATHNWNAMKKKLSGNQVVTIYDMETMEVTYGPEFPYPLNHGACAVQENLIHCTGGFLETKKKDAWKASSDAHYILDISDKNAVWQKAADMPLRRGAHGCTFLRDEKMYCVGGAVNQWGPFANELMIYNPSTDSWELGKSMQFPRDHLFDSVVAIDGGSKMYVAGGKTHLKKLPPGVSNPRIMLNSNKVEVYDVKKKTWERKNDLLSARAAISVVPFHRNGPDKPANLILLGGEFFQGLSGQVYKVVEEYDIQSDLYYCLPSLAWPYFGGGVGIHDGKLHVVGGGDWFGAAAVRRVQIYDLNEAPKPRQCFYDQVPIFDQYDRNWDKRMPYPDINDYDSEQAKRWRHL